MFPFHPTSVAFSLNILIIFLCAAIGLALQNPLALLGLLLLQPVPHFATEMESEQEQEMPTDEELDEPIPLANKSRIGFHSQEKEAA